METKTTTFDIAQLRHSAHQAEGLLKQLANSNRLMILCHLLKGEKDVSTLEALVDLSQSALSQHLAKMKKDGLVGCTRHGRRMFYHVADPAAVAMLNTLYLLYCHHSETK